MPAPIRTSTTDTFRNLQVARAERNETNDCAVIAVAVATGASYDTAHRALAEAGRKHRDTSYNGQIFRALAALGCKYERVATSVMIARYPKPHCNVLKNVTSHHMDRFPAAWADGETYLCFTAGHVFAVRDGVNHDWTRGRVCRVFLMVKVTRAD